MMEPGRRFVSEFPLEEPPTTPHRTLSGSMIKGSLVKAIAVQQTAVADCSKMLDELIYKASELSHHATGYPQ